MLNINRASQSQWQRFPGIGPAMARRILEQRARRPFKEVAELASVRGIGPAFLAKYRNQLSCSGPSTLSAHTDQSSGKAAAIAPE